MTAGAATQYDRAKPSPLRLLSGAAYAGMFACGVMFALLGAVLPSLSERLSFSLADIGTLFLVMNFAMLVTSLVLGVAMDRFGMKAPLMLGPCLVATALVLLAQAREMAMLFPAVACLGAGGGALNGATNTLVADLHDDARKKSAALNLLGVFFGFGALFLPFSLGALMARVGVNGLLYGTAMLCVLAGGFAAVLRFPAPKQAKKLPVGEMPRFLRMPLVLAMALLLFFESGNEFLLGGYFTTFLTRELRVDVEAASYALAAFWASIMATRLALSRLLLRFDGHAVIFTCALLAATGAALVGLSAGTASAMAGIVLTGLALSGVFPTLLGIAGSEFREHSGTVFGILFTVALTGGMLMPWLSGQLAEQWGVRWVFALAAANFLAIVAMNEVTRRVRVRTKVMRGQ